MSGDELAGLGILLFSIAIVIVALRDKASRDADGRIKRFSRAYWIIFFFVPFGQLWCLARAFDRPATEPSGEISQDPQEPSGGA